MQNDIHINGWTNYQISQRDTQNYVFYPAVSKQLSSFQHNKVMGFLSPLPSVAPLIIGGTNLWIVKHYETMPDMSVPNTCNNYYINLNAHFTVALNLNVNIITTVYNNLP